MAVKVRMYSYKRKSESANLLAEKLGVPILMHEGGAYHPDKKDVIVNWGCGCTDRMSPYLRAGMRIINSPKAVAAAIDKYQTFLELEGTDVPVPSWTTDRGLAKRWLKKAPVIARQTTEGKGGEGLVVMETEKDFVAAPLYTKFIPKTHEYRVYVINGIGTRTFEKVPDPANPLKDIHKKYGIYGIDYKFVKRDAASGKVYTAAKSAIKAIGLDFGAVDLGYDKATDTCVVYEVNTAPSLPSEVMVKFYADGINELVAKEA